MPVKQLSSVLIKPAGPDCNLDCTYCFYLDRANLFGATRRHRMSEAVLEEMVRQVMRDGAPQVNFGWQGGEPTLMGLDFFRKAVEFQQRYGERGQLVGNGLQTNGLLLDEEWAAFLREYKFLVGLSLDGPREVHDHYRVTKGGQPSWERVVRSARMLVREKVELNALTVVSKHSVQYAEQIYAFHKSLGLRHMQFIPCVETDPSDTGKMADFSVTPEAYGDFLCRIFDMWQKDFKNGRPTTSVRWFDSVFATYVGFGAPECTLLGECGCYVVVEHNGDVFACDFFVEPGWKLGNVMQDALIEMLNSPRQGEFGRAKAQLPPECPDCEWLRHCYGGCPKDRLRNPQTHGSNHFCRSFKMFFEHANPRLTRLAEDWKREQRAAASRQMRVASRR